MAGEVGSIFVRVGADLSGFERGMARLQTRLSSASGGFAGITKAAKVLGLGVAAVGAASLNAAGNFEQALNTFQAVSKATGKDMEKVSDLAKALGKDIKLPATSAKDAAQAMTELAKGGLSVNESMKAARATLQLAAAAETDVATAAETVSDALNAFKLPAKDATRITDLLANAANATTGDIHDFSLAMKMSAAVAHQLGVPIEDLTTMLGQMANAGIKGSDAGTSLKTMLLSLAAPTGEAAKLMDDLGVSMFDAQGKFVGTRSMIEQFNTALSGMTQEQKAATLATIFGSDAVRAAGIIFGETAPQFDALKAKMEEQGAAAALAEAKMKGFKGGLEGFKSAVETLGISIGETLLPAATAIVGKLSEVANWMNQNKTATLAFIGVIAGFAGTVLTINAVASAVKAVGNAFGVAQSAVGLFGGAMGALKFGLITAGVAGLAFGIKELVEWTRQSNTAFDQAMSAATRYKTALDALKGITLSTAQAELNLRQAQLSRSQAQAALSAMVRAGEKTGDSYKAAVLAVEQAELNEKKASLDLATATKSLSAAKVDAKAKTDAAAASIARFEERAHTATGAAELLKVGVRFAAGELQGLNNQANRSAILRAYSSGLHAISGAAGGTSSALGTATAKAAALAGQIRSIPTYHQSIIDIITRTFTMAFAHGGVVRDSLALVGEQGPELVALPTGSRVFPSGESRRMMSDAGTRAMPRTEQSAGGFNGDVNVYVTLDGRQIAASVRTENLQHGRRNPTIYSGTGITA